MHSGPSGLRLGGPLDEEGWRFGGETGFQQATPYEHDGGRVHALWRALYQDVGRQGSLMEQPDGESFLARPAFGGAVAHTPFRMLAPLPDGDVTSHLADLAIGWDGGPWLYVDVVPEWSGLDVLKARCFDAMLTRQREGGCHPVLVWLRSEGGMDREAVEAIAHPFRFLFGMHEEELPDARAFGALRQYITAWLADRAPRRQTRQ